MSGRLRQQIRSALDSIIVLNGSQGAAAAQANRVYMTIYLVMASPEYLVQK
jgi:hypothetical protein